MLTRCSYQPPVRNRTQGTRFGSRLTAMRTAVKPIQARGHPCKTVSIKAQHNGFVVDMYNATGGFVGRL